MFNFLEKQMKIKRVYFAFMALLLLPVTAMAQLTVPTPQPGTAVVVVSVFFNGSFGGQGPATTLNLQCSAASVSPTNVVVMDPEAFEYEQAFILSQIPGNVANVCTVTADPVAGYSTEYSCNSYGYSGGTAPCTSPQPLTSCQFSDVQIGEWGGCVVDHNVNPVEVTVTKEWDITNAVNGGDFYSLKADVDIRCDAKMSPGFGHFGDYKYKWSLDDGDYVDGVAVTVIDVYPDYKGSTCWASEDDVDSAVEVSSTCGRYDTSLHKLVGAMKVGVGMGASCTITNTLFFEGIPTLNQYGMAIMALLMLGVGFVGFRRFF
jgi:hypothetical protein